MRMVSFQKYDGFPSARLEARIDTFSFGADFVQKILVALYVSSAGSADLHERKSALISRIHLQKVFDTAEAFENSLGIVYAVHSNAEQAPFNSQLFKQCRAFRARTARYFGFRSRF